jgi:hypothetical protein
MSISEKRQSSLDHAIPEDIVLFFSKCVKSCRLGELFSGIWGIGKLGSSIENFYYVLRLSV